MITDFFSANVETLAHKDRVIVTYQSYALLGKSLSCCKKPIFFSFHVLFLSFNSGFKFSDFVVCFIRRVCSAVCAVLMIF